MDDRAEQGKVPRQALLADSAPPEEGSVRAEGNEVVKRPDDGDTVVPESMEDGGGDEVVDHLGMGDVGPEDREEGRELPLRFEGVDRPVVGMAAVLRRLRSSLLPSCRSEKDGIPSRADRS